VAAVHHHSHPDSWGQIADQNLVDEVINEVTCSPVVHRDQNFIQPVGFSPTGILYLSTVTAVVKEEAVSGPCIVHQPLHVLNDVGAGGLATTTGEPWVVDKDASLLQRELNSAEQIQYRLDVIDASTKFTGLAKVIDSDEETTHAAPRVGLGDLIWVDGSDSAGEGRNWGWAIVPTLLRARGGTCK
jgi:hypothetical protein